MARRVPAGSPRMKAAVRRTAAAKNKAMAAANEQLGKENRIRVIVAKPPQELEKYQGTVRQDGRLKKVPFKR